MLIPKPTDGDIIPLRKIPTPGPSQREGRPSGEGDEKEEEVREEGIKNR
jgi:hypothetical protein